MGEGEKRGRRGLVGCGGTKLSLSRLSPLPRARLSSLSSLSPSFAHNFLVGHPLRLRLPASPPPRPPVAPHLELDSEYL
eukprot:scaffold33700_cov30-Tisochrysis_lutea.AAC.2